MSLSPGVRVGQYEVIELVGSGGMGEVYRAHDTKLNRDVALKILPDAFTRDATRRARFEREAQLLAALNHPHIATLHGLESFAGNECLVMELVPGVTLAERLEHGALSVADALPLLVQIASALEAAHDKGIVHRDLKPANVKITPEARVKVLDFGLATSLETQPAPDLSHSPTALASGSAVGTITGTAAYMSPEQARGLPVDRRTDVWAFGCVCYEALSGRKAFKGSTLTDVLADVTRAEPDWTAIAGAPERVRDLIRRCLRKEKERRLQSIADARIELEDAISNAASDAAPAVAPGAARRWIVPVSVAAVAVLAGVLVFKYLKTPGPAPAMHAAIEIPPNGIGYFSGLLISPDGRTVVYGGAVGGGQLFRRRMDSAGAEAIPGAEAVYHPFMSPDGEWIGFFGQGKLKKIPLAGGVPQDIAAIETDGHSSASWGADGTIVFVQGPRHALWQVSASGGTPRLLAEPDPARKERSFLDPAYLPGGQILFTISSDSGFGVAVLVPSTGERRMLVAEGRYPRYAPTGYLLFWQDYSVRAAPFDLSRLTLTGAAEPAVQDVSALGGWGPAFDISGNGTLVYYPAFEDKMDRTLTWVDRRGAATSISESRKNLYVTPRISPDGRQAIIRFEGPGDCYLNTLDLARGAWSRLTFLGDSELAAWSPDSTRIAFQSERAAGYAIVMVPAAGGPEQNLYVSPHEIGSISWSPDGQFLAFDEKVPGHSDDISVIPAAGGQPRVFLQTPFSERQPEFSPDGKWIAYTSDESGVREVYVRPFPGPGPKTVISVGGGQTVRWTKGGRELLYRTNKNVMSVAVDTAHGFSAGKPETAFAVGDYQLGGGYDVSADGERLLVVKSRVTPASTQIQMVVNWFTELKTRVPAK